MTISVSLKEYLGHIQLEQLFNELGASDPETLARTAKHFATREGRDRDRIVMSYFGQGGIRRIVDTVTKHLLEQPGLSSHANVLDVGAGTGFFTVRVAKKLRGKIPDASFYAIDLTPAMLFSLTNKKANIVPFVGLAENIRGSIEHAREYFNVPSKFDMVFSTLMLHHSTHPEAVLKSIKEIVRKHGRTVVVDLCEHNFKEFRTEMGDVHLGFKIERVRAMAHHYFLNVKVEKLPGIRCESSGRSAEMFVATMENPR